MNKLLNAASSNSLATRGKLAETQVKKTLEKLAVSSSFAYIRAPDARAGSFVQAVADYILCLRGRMMLIEVKQTAHDYRLPVGSFKQQQRARLALFQAAGAAVYILIMHSTTKVWRAEPLNYFGNLDTGSWDFRERTEYKSSEAAIQQIFKEIL